MNVTHRLPLRCLPFYFSSGWIGHRGKKKAQNHFGIITWLNSKNNTFLILMFNHTIIIQRILVSITWFNPFFSLWEATSKRLESCNIADMSRCRRVTGSSMVWYVWLWKFSEPTSRQHRNNFSCYSLSVWAVMNKWVRPVTVTSGMPTFTERNVYVSHEWLSLRYTK